MPIFDMPPAAVMEVESPAGGILAKILVQAGEEVPVAEVVALILSPQEYQAQVAAPPLAVPQAPLTSASRSDLPQAAAYSGVGQALTLPRADLEGDKRKRLASPKARRIAADLGLDLAGLVGSGPQGAVLASDVWSKAVERSRESAVLKDTPPEPVHLPEQPSGPAAALPSNAPGAQEQPISQPRPDLGGQPAPLWSTIAQFHLQREANATRLLAWLAQAGARSSQKVTLTDLMVRLVARALKRHPAIHSVWLNGRIHLATEIHIGLTMILDEGLAVGVIRGADRLSLEEIAAARAQLEARARSGSLRPEDVQDGTFTLSDLGTLGLDRYAAPMLASQAAILALGQVSERYVQRGGQAILQPQIRLSLSTDPRVLDGVLGARFLLSLVELIEDPLRLLE